jgi:hypothetical protein
MNTDELRQALERTHKTVDALKTAVLDVQAALGTLTAIAALAEHPLKDEVIGYYNVRTQEFLKPGEFQLRPDSPDEWRAARLRPLPPPRTLVQEEQKPSCVIDWGEVDEELLNIVGRTRTISPGSPSMIDDLRALLRKVSHGS